MITSRVRRLRKSRVFARYTKKLHPKLKRIATALRKFLLSPMIPPALFWIVLGLGIVALILLTPRPLSLNPYAGFGSITTPVGEERGELGSEEVRGYGYFLGQCTDYASRMAGTPQNWGDAWEWPDNARKAGWEVSRVPSVGAIAQVDNHVAYVEIIQGNGIYVSEMNFDGNWNVVTTRWTSVEDWRWFISK